VPNAISRTEGTYSWMRERVVRVGEWVSGRVGEWVSRLLKGRFTRPLAHSPTRSINREKRRVESFRQAALRQATHPELLELVYRYLRGSARRHHLKMRQ